MEFPSCSFISQRLLVVSLLVHLGIAALPARAEDPAGPVRIVPASAPAMVLEALASGTTQGTPVSIAAPSGAPNQQWIFTPKGDGFYSVAPKHCPGLALAAAQGGNTDGTALVLETAKDQPWQLWKIRKNENGTIALQPKHSPEKAMDDFRGEKNAGAKQDIWAFNSKDEHVQWNLLAAGSPLPTAAATQAASAPAQAAASVPQGVIKTFPYTGSVIFPGTTRTVTVFIPAQYDGSQPACVYVRQDGYNPKEKAFLEQLIAAKEMPVTIGVFVTPGQLLAPSKEASPRRNRCFEYDGVGDSFARFINDEILPCVASQLGLKLSTSPNDRCIAGASSGGISAFNAAWERPDFFSRVYACSGSFVAFRGGHELSTLVRKCEPKPIRAYLTTATQDMENCAGDWFLLDQEMDKALKFSGYEYTFTALEGKHCAGWNDHFCDAMRFIWKGWPEPVKAGLGAPRVRDILLPGEGWQLVEKGYRDARGPACNAAGEVFFADPAANKCYRIGTDGKPTVFLADAGHAEALSVGPGGELYAVSTASGQLMRYDGAGKAKKIAEGLRGRYVLARPDGALYVSGPGSKSEQTDNIWLVKDGKVTVVDSGIKHATGMAYRPDQWLLSVADGQSRWVYSFEVKPDGTLANKERFFWLHQFDWDENAGPEAVCYAQEGQMFVATREGIQVCADDGPTQVILPMPDRSRVLGVCIGGPEHDTLYAFCGDKIWKRKVKTHGFGAFSPCAKSPSSRL